MQSTPDTVDGRNGVVADLTAKRQSTLAQAERVRQTHSMTRWLRANPVLGRPCAAFSSNCLGQFPKAKVSQAPPPRAEILTTSRQLEDNMLTNSRQVASTMLVQTRKSKGETAADQLAQIYSSLPTLWK